MFSVLPYFNYLDVLIIPAWFTSQVFYSFLIYHKSNSVAISYENH